MTTDTPEDVRALAEVEALTRDFIAAVHGSPQNERVRSAMWKLTRALNAPRPAPSASQGAAPILAAIETWLEGLCDSAEDLKNAVTKTLAAHPAPDTTKRAAEDERDRLYVEAENGMHAAKRDRDEYDYNLHLGGLVWLKSFGAMLPADRRATREASKAEEGQNGLR